MYLDLTYRQIWRISAPIMLGSAVQNVIALSDAILLQHYGRTEFASIGFVGVFYITIAAIGYSFSRGGQIMIARRMGEGRPEAVGHVFHTMLLFELALAAVMWAVMRFGSSAIFPLFLDHSPEIYAKCLEYIHYRSYGIFFSYAGVAIISLYTGIARPAFVFVSTVILAAINLALNYALIFGRWGMPEMGIGGSGLASSIAEGVAFILFIGFMVLDKKNRPLRIFSMPQPDWPMTRQQLRISLPVVAQAAIGQGSWVLFFGMVENLGVRAMEISNLTRNVYLLLSIPMWGFASGANTLISNLIGQSRHREVWSAAKKTALLCWLVTALIAIPMLIWPETLISPLLDETGRALISETRPVFNVLFVILGLATVGTVMFNSLAGTGATWFGLVMQSAGIAVYLVYIYGVIHHTHWGLPWVWAAEVVYWVIMLSLTVWYLRSDKWHSVEV